MGMRVLFCLDIYISEIFWTASRFVQLSDWLGVVDPAPSPFLSHCNKHCYVSKKVRSYLHVL